MSTGTRGVSRDRIPSLAHVLSTFAIHVHGLATDRPKRTDAPYSERALFGLGLGGFAGTDCPFAFVREVEITPSDSIASNEPWGPWAQVSFDGVPQGNRCGAISAYAARCAPVIAWVTNYWARNTAATAALMEVK